jgi:hypothetical protein
MQLGYQQTTGTTIVPPSVDDIGYTPPVASRIDDGITFPPSKADVLISEQVHGTLDNQVAGIISAFNSARQIAKIEAGGGSSPSTDPESRAIQIAVAVAVLGVNTVAYQLKLNPIWYDLQLKPVDAGPFEAAYEIIVTKLSIPQGINLEAPSSP